MWPPIRQLRDRDPNGYALHRAIRAAVVIPSIFALSYEVIGNPTIATFTAFGGFALLLFVDFPGNWAGRLTSYAMLVLTGAVFIVLGTLASRFAWIAVAGMIVVGFAVLFAGVLSAAIAAGGRAALLMFILPVTMPGGLGDVPFRLAGWGIAAAVAIPASMLVWAPREHDDLRRYAADTCLAIAGVITSRDAGAGAPNDAQCGQVTHSLAALRNTFHGTAFRPVGLTTGSRALIRLVSELEWLSSVVVTLTTDEIRGWPVLAREAVLAAADVLRASAAMLGADRRSSLDDDHGLNDALARLAAARHRIATETAVLIGQNSRDPIDLPYQGHELGYAASLVGATVWWAAESDARPVLDRVLGRPGPNRGDAPLSPVLEIATSQIERHSVWLQNSLRGAAGLGLSVLVVELTSAQHGFWIVLGALSVLRSTALSTGSTALRAVVGTLVGFLVGAGIVLAIGTSTGILWAVLPIAILVAGFAPAAISFAAGQAAFTVLLLVLFNIIVPVGWQIGLLRLEDVLLGCAASVVVGVLAWPRGAAAAIGTALSRAYRIGADYLDQAVRYTVEGTPVPATELRDVLAAGRRLDDALRQYLAERGAKTVPLADLVAAANGAIRLRQAGEAIIALRAQGNHTGDLRVRFAETTALVCGQADSVQAWYTAFADGYDPHHVGDPPPLPQLAGAAEDVVDALRHDLPTTRDGATDGAKELTEEAGQAKSLYMMSLFLQDLRGLEARLRNGSPPLPAPALAGRAS